MLLDTKAKRAKQEATIIKQPVARPSRPSVKLTAFEEPITTNRINRKAIGIHSPERIKMGSLKNGKYNRVANSCRERIEGFSPNSLIMGGWNQLPIARESLQLGHNRYNANREAIAA